MQATGKENPQKGLNPQKDSLSKTTIVAPDNAKAFSAAASSNSAALTRWLPNFVTGQVSGLKERVSSLATGVSSGFAKGASSIQNVVSSGLSSVRDAAYSGGSFVRDAAYSAAAGPIGAAAALLPITRYTSEEKKEFLSLINIQEEGAEIQEEGAEIIDAFVRLLDTPVVKELVRKALPKGLSAVNITPFAEFFVYRYVNHFIKQGNETFNKDNSPLSAKEIIINAARFVMDKLSSDMLTMQNNEALFTLIPEKLEGETAEEYKERTAAKREELKELLKENFKDSLPELIDSCFKELPWPIQQAANFKNINSESIQEIAISLIAESFEPHVQKPQEQSYPVANSVIDKTIERFWPEVRKAFEKKENPLTSHSSVLAEGVTFLLNKHNGALGTKALHFTQEIIEEACKRVPEAAPDGRDKTWSFAGGVIKETVQRFFINMAKNSPQGAEEEDFLTRGVFNVIEKCLPELKEFDEKALYTEFEAIMAKKEIYELNKRIAQNNSPAAWANESAFVEARKEYDAAEDALIAKFKPLALSLLEQGGMVEKKVVDGREEWLPVESSLTLPHFGSAACIEMLKEVGIPYVLYRFARDIISHPRPSTLQLDKTEKEKFEQFSTALRHEAVPLINELLKEEQNRELLAEEFGAAIGSEQNPVTPVEKEAIAHWILKVADRSNSLIDTLWHGVDEHLVPRIITNALEHLAAAGMKNGERGAPFHCALSHATKKILSIVQDMQQWPSRVKMSKEEIKEKLYLYQENSAQIHSLTKEEKEANPVAYKKLCNDQEKLRGELAAVILVKDGKPIFNEFLEACGYRSKTDLPVPCIFDDEIWKALTEKLLPDQLLQLYSDLTLSPRASDKELEKEQSVPLGNALKDIIGTATSKVRYFLRNEEGSVSLKKILAFLPNSLTNPIYKDYKETLEFHKGTLESVAKALLADDNHPLWSVIENYVTSYTQNIIANSLEKEEIPEGSNALAVFAAKLTASVGKYLNDHREEFKNQESKESYQAMVGAILKELNLEDEQKWRLPQAIRAKVFDQLVKEFLPSQLQAKLSAIFSLAADKEELLENLAERFSKECYGQRKERSKQLIATLSEFSGDFAVDFLQKALMEKSGDIVQLADQFVKEFAPDGKTLNQETWDYLSAVLRQIGEEGLTPETKKFVSTLLQAITLRIATNLADHVKPGEGDSHQLPAAILINLTRLIHQHKADFERKVEPLALNIRTLKSRQGLQNDPIIQKKIKELESQIAEQFKPLVDELLEKSFPQGKELPLWDTLQEKVLPTLAAQIFLDMTNWVYSKRDMLGELNRIFKDHPPLWNKTKGRRDPINVCQELASWAVKTQLPSLLKDKKFLSTLTDTLLKRLPSTITNKIDRQQLKEVICSNCKKLANDPDSPLHLFRSEINSFVESAIMRGVIGTVGTIDEIETWYEKINEGKDPLQKNFLLAVVGDTVKSVQQNFKALNEIKTADKRELYNIPAMELYDKLKAKGVLHPGVASPHLSADEKKAHEIEHFYKPFSDKLWDIVSHHKAEGIPDLKDLPVPHQIKSLLAEAIPKEFMPELLQSIISSQLTDQQLNQRLSSAFKLIRNTLNDSRVSSDDDPDVIMIDDLDRPGEKKPVTYNEILNHPDSSLHKLCEECGKLTMQILKAMPNAGANLFMMIPLVRNKTSYAIGWAIIQKVGIIRTAALLKQILGELDTADFDTKGKDITEEEVAHELAKLKVTAFMNFLPNVLLNKATKIRKMTDNFVKKVMGVFGETVQKYAMIVKKWIDKIIWKIFDSLAQLLSIPFKPLQSFLAWLLGKIWLNKSSLHDIRVAKVYIPNFAFKHMDEVVSHYYAALQEMVKHKEYERAGRIYHPQLKTMGTLKETLTEQLERINPKAKKAAAEAAAIVSDDEG